MRAALEAGEDRLVYRLGVRLLTQDEGAARTAEGLVGRRGHHVGVGDRIRMGAPGHEAGEVGHVDQEDAPRLVGDGAEFLEIELPRIGGVAGDEDLRLVLQRHLADLVVIEEPGLGVEAVVDGVEPLARRARLGAVGEVSAVAEVEAEHRVAGLGEREVDGEVGRRARVGLHVGVLGAEQSLGALDAQGLQSVAVDLSLVVPGARITLRILVLEHGAAGFQNRFGGVILAGDQADRRALIGFFRLHQLKDFKVVFFECAHRIAPLFENRLRR